MAVNCHVAPLVIVRTKFAFTFTNGPRLVFYASLLTAPRLDTLCAIVEESFYLLERCFSAVCVVI